jgi:hypothetical protein
VVFEIYEKKSELNEDSEANSDHMPFNSMSYCSLKVCGIDVKRYGCNAPVCLLMAEPFLVGGREGQMYCTDV